LRVDHQYEGRTSLTLLRVILKGIREPATPEIGFMPAFRDGRRADRAEPDTLRQHATACSMSRSLGFSHRAID
jgi:hypothetical protein